MYNFHKDGYAICNIYRSTISIFRIFSRLKLSETDTIQITRDKGFGNPAVCTLRYRVTLLFYSIMQALFVAKNINFRNGRRIIVLTFEF